MFSFISMRQKLDGTNSTRIKDNKIMALIVFNISTLLGRKVLTVIEADFDRKGYIKQKENPVT